MNLVAAEHLRQIGKPVPRLDGGPKVSGQTRYTADVVLPGMAWGKCLRSALPHARIAHIDTAEAKRVKGVLAVLTAADVPRRLFGRMLKDTPVLAQEKVRFAGEKIAAVAAESLEAAEEALDLIRVEYQELEAVYDPVAAMSPGAPILHEQLKSYRNLRLPLPDIPNVHSHVQLTVGDAEEGFADSDLVFEQTFTTQRVHHGYLEPHAVLVSIDGSGRILVWYPAKGPYAARQQFAEWLGVADSDIVFQLSPVGGDFGGKGSLMDVPICYCLAKATGRPVKMVMSYFEELTAANPRHPSIITIKSGVKRDGRLWARAVKAVFNSGAYAGFKNNETINLPGSRHGAGAYRIPNVKIDAYSVYTNSVPSGIMRGPGEAQIAFAVESHTDHVARGLGIDPYEFRCINVLKRGDRLPYGMRLESDLGKELLKRLAALRWHSSQNKAPYVGRGMALCVREISLGEANVEMGVTDEGAVYILTTVPDTGTGAHTIFRQIAAETLGLPGDVIEVRLGTTDSFPTDAMVAASRVTYVAGQATRSAALALRELMLEKAARSFGCNRDQVRIINGGVHAGGKRTLSFAELAARSRSRGRVLAVRGNYKVQERSGAASFFAQAAEVAVDPETGAVKILKLLSVHDVGTIINPLTHQGQVEGGLIQGLGFALTEDLADQDGRVIAANLGEYKLPSIMDLPRHQTLLVQDLDGPGPFRSKPIGEHSAVPTAPAIANAIYDAIGVRITDLPITAEKVYYAWKERQRTGDPLRAGREPEDGDRRKQPGRERRCRSI
ncbi:MAG TPA: xanthine dehydrogenase family protein molybdopterin-binding subunit [Candidatus Eisenbacteria bacterium]|nr:xanthine dehydrogenase family protein molybdopterin-binding subunit [Candidatus Eisenbacteria bacterium]